MSGLGGAELGRYRTPEGADRTLRLLDAEQPAARLPLAVLAARVEVRGGLVLDTTSGGHDERLLARLDPGEGLAAARALVADYRPRAERTSRPLARRLQSEDLLELTAVAA